MFSELLFADQNTTVSKLPVGWEQLLVGSWHVLKKKTQQKTTNHGLNRAKDKRRGNSICGLLSVPSSL